MVQSNRRTPLPERRAFQRYPCRVSLAPNVTMVDVSEGGAQLECGWRVPVGAVVPLPTDNLFARPLGVSVPFQVVHVRQIPETGRHRIHGRFLDMPAPAASAFKAVLQRIGNRPTGEQQ